ncbi:hypothetical protein J6R97_07240 [bacterium]|nr:hypothetical protein [bacterium]
MIKITNLTIPTTQKHQGNITSNGTSTKPSGVKPKKKPVATGENERTDYIVAHRKELEELKKPLKEFKPNNYLNNNTTKTNGTSTNNSPNGTWEKIDGEWKKVDSKVFIPATTSEEKQDLMKKFFD